MAITKYTGVGITAIAAAIPKRIINNLSYTEYFSSETAKAIVEKTGIYQRRFADEHTCASDLCFAAAERLISDNAIDKQDIDILVFVSQTPDFRMPATSIILQERLGLSKQTIAFDINLGCSAYIYALNIVYAMLQSSHLKKALILDGETRSKVYSPKDQRCAFLFGDAGSATLVEKEEKYGDSFFSMNSDGSRENLIKIDGGGYRNPSSAQTLEERIVDEYGNIRSDKQGYMNGADVFHFVLTEIPKDIKTLCHFANYSTNMFDYIIFHQANNFINNHIAKKLKLDRTKMPSSLKKFGNTSSVSIPLTIASELKGQLNGANTTLFSAFGVGMSWASAIINLHDCKTSAIVEV